MTAARRQALYRVLACIAVMLAAVPARAQQIMNDPTRPPASVLAGGGADIDAGPLLQSVIITPGSRAAIIGGERVPLGGKYGDAKVIKITESEVVLRSAGGTETLRMYPNVEMKAARPRAAVR